MAELKTKKTTASAIDTIKANSRLAPIYVALKKAVLSLGPVTIESKQTSLHIKARAGFAGVHPRKDHLILQIVSAQPIKDKWVFKVEKVSANRVHNHIRLAEPADVDQSIKKYLHQAYALQS